MLHGGCHSECITLMSRGIKNCRTVLSYKRFFWVFLIRKLSGMVDVFCSIVAYMCGGEWNIIL